MNEQIKIPKLNKEDLKSIGEMIREEINLSNAKKELEELERSQDRTMRIIHFAFGFVMGVTIYQLISLIIQGG